jgi:hypothetical protein
MKASLEFPIHFLKIYRSWHPPDVAGVASNGAAVAAKLRFMAFSASIDPLDVSLLARRGVSLLKFHPWLHLVPRGRKTALTRGR